MLSLLASALPQPRQNLSSGAWSVRPHLSQGGGPKKSPHHPCGTGETLVAGHSCSSSELMASMPDAQDATTAGAASTAGAIAAVAAAATEGLAVVLQHVLATAHGPFAFEPEGACVINEQKLLIDAGGE